MGYSNGITNNPGAIFENTIQPVADTAAALQIRQHSGTQSAPLLSFYDAAGSTFLGGVGPNASAVWKGLALNVTPKTANYTTLGTDYYIPVDATAGPVTITLKVSTGAPFGSQQHVTKIDSSANAVTVQRGGADTINGGTSITLASQNDTAVLQSDGAGAWNAVLPFSLTPAVILAPNSVDRNLIQPTADANHGLVLKNFSATLTGANPFEHRLSNGTVTSRLLPGGNWSCPGAGGVNSEQFGIGATAAGTGGSTAFGAGADASGLNGSTAFGSAAVASGQWSTALGSVATATNDDSIAIGLNSTSTGVYSVALGDDTSATADQATCLGGASRATAVGAVALGQNARATHLGAIAIGAGVNSAAAHEVRFPASSIFSFFGGTAAGPQTGGAATAGVLYTATEQAMVNACYSCLRTFGLLT